MTRISLTTFFLIFLTLFCVQIQGEEIDRFAAIVNNSVITLSQVKLESAIANSPLSMTENQNKNLTEKDILNHLIDRHLIVTEAQRFIQTDQGVIDKKLSEIAKKVGGKEQFQEILSDLMMSTVEYKHRIRNIIMFQAYIDQRIRGFIQIQPEEIEQYIREHATDLGLESFNTDSGAKNDISQLKKLVGKYLVESEVNQKLDARLQELRQNSNINIIELE